MSRHSDTCATDHYRDRQAPCRPKSPNAIKVLPGSVFIAPRNPVAGFQDLGYISEIDDERDRQYRKWGDDGLLPRRNILDGSTLTIHDVKLTPEAIALLTGSAITQKKESTVIDKKNFEKYTYRTNANDLSGRHIGALVKVKTKDGVEITDVLTGVQAGEYVKHQGAAAGKVLVTLKHYKTYYGELAGVLLDGSSAVTVRHAIVDGK